VSDASSLAPIFEVYTWRFRPLLSLKRTKWTFMMNNWQRDKRYFWLVQAKQFRTQLILFAIRQYIFLTYLIETRHITHALYPGFQFCAYSTASRALSRCSSALQRADYAAARGIDAIKMLTSWQLLNSNTVRHVIPHIVSLWPCRADCVQVFPFVRSWSDPSSCTYPERVAQQSHLMAFLIAPNLSINVH
jgi:hypothetical protein